MEFKGTKGEWEARKLAEGFCVGRKEYNVLHFANCWCEGIGGLESDEEAEANAKLIAAAPDLLEALQELLETCPCDTDITTEFWQANQKAKQAIEKALK